MKVSKFFLLLAALMVVVPSSMMKANAIRVTKATTTNLSATKKNNKKGVEKKKNGGDVSPVGIWPCMDELDKKLIMISIPMIINFSITPLVGANDLFWTNRMNNALAVAGQAAATQVFNSGFWVSICTM